MFNSEHFFRRIFYAFLILCCCVAGNALRANAAQAARRITLHTQPAAAVWLDDVRYGTTDAEGNLSFKLSGAGRHTLRVRAVGYKEKSLPLAPAQSMLSVLLVATGDAAELAFQQAEAQREKASDAAGRAAAVELYRKALAARPVYAEAQVGLARVLADMNRDEEALDAIDAARAARPNYAEASTVEGRILRSQAQNEEASAAFKRALREAHDFQPEALTGLALIYQETGDMEHAAEYFKRAAAQLGDTDPIIYQLLGDTYERLERYDDALAAYDKFVAVAPNHSLAPAVRSMATQLRKQIAEQHKP